MPEDRPLSTNPAAVRQRLWRRANPARNASTAQRTYAANADHYRAKARKRGTPSYGPRRQLLNWLKAVPCKDCLKLWPSYVMEFDHRKGEEKKFSIGNWPVLHTVSVFELQEELQKCDLVCANCHRLRTYGSAQWKK